jgi:predicted phosphohydrolase
VCGWKKKKVIKNVKWLNSDVKILTILYAVSMMEQLKEKEEPLYVRGLGSLRRSKLASMLQIQKNVLIIPHPRDAQNQGKVFVRGLGLLISLVALLKEWLNYASFIPHHVSVQPPFRENRARGI